VGVIYAESGKELLLETVLAFKSSDVMLVGRESTNYICKYISYYKWILNITSNHSFAMDGGILNCGVLNCGELCNSYYFSFISGINAYINIKYIEIKFLSEMYFLLYVEGGTVRFEFVKLKNEIIKFVEPFIFVNSINSVIIELISLNITNCIYSARSGLSSIIYFYNQPIFLSSSFLNISSSFLQHNYFNFNNHYSIYGFGGIGCLYSRNFETGFFFFFNIILF
jgi:hypothetical protein